MKRIFITIAAALTLLASCAPAQSENSDKALKVVHTNSVRVETYDFTYTDLYEAELNGHIYVIGRAQDAISILHSPNCPCQKQSTSSAGFNW